MCKSETKNLLSIDAQAYTVPMNVQTNDINQRGNCGLDESVFPFWAAQGGLREHWYPIDFSHRLKRDQSGRQVIMGVPVLLWRTSDDNLQGFLDVCPHRQAQLSQGPVGDAGISCPYHGWRFGSDGRCNHIPIAPPKCLPREPAELIRIPVCEQNALMWAWMGTQRPTSEPDDLLPATGRWQFTQATEIFPFDLDDTIENFMDFAHTPVVHPGLIRGISSAIERGVTIETTDVSVRAVHAPVAEQVGMLSRLVVPSGDVHHTDTFLMPGTVLVEYGFGDERPSFIALLAMSPVAENQTRILITLGTQFGFSNRLVHLAIPLLLRKILKQDADVLTQQRENLDLMSRRPRKSLACDAVDSIVRAVRSHACDPQLPNPKPGTRHLRVRL